MQPNIEVVTNDGQKFEGTPKQVVRQMRNTQWGAPMQKGDWMDEVADRVASMTGRPCARTPVPFLKDLERAKLVTIQPTAG